MRMARISVVTSVIVAATISVSASTLKLHRTVAGTDVVAAGVGGLRNVGWGVIRLNGVNGAVREAWLYWHGPTSALEPAANATLTLHGMPVRGELIGTTSDLCWGFERSEAYRADVTSIVAVFGNGDYRIAGLRADSLVNSNGASLVVFFDDGVSLDDRDVLLFDGNDGNVVNDYDPNGWDMSVTGFAYTHGTARLELHVSDGQVYADPALYLDSWLLAPGGALFQGTSVPSANKGPNGTGSLWDIRAFDVSSYLAGPPDHLHLLSGSSGDCVALVAALVDLPAHAAPSAHLTLKPAEANVCAGLHHELQATLVDGDGKVLAGRRLGLEIASGPSAPLALDQLTDTAGQAVFAWGGGLATGVDVAQVCTRQQASQAGVASIPSGAAYSSFAAVAGPVSLAETCAAARVTWIDCNHPPEVSDAHASSDCLWPPNHSFRRVTIAGVTDPDGDPLSITVTRVTSDEATATERGAGGIRHAPDATAVGAAAVKLRAERSGLGDGRVYQVSFVADDGRGGVSPGVVEVRVPHDAAGACAAVDSRPPEFDATE